MKAMHCVLMACLLAAPLAGCRENPATGEQELILLSPEEEIRIGEQAAPQFEEAFGGPVPNDYLQAYISRIGQQVAAQAERDVPYGFTVLRSDLPNAFALPGGKVYITAGLLKTMENEEELAAVLGHEIGHVAALHNVKALQRGMGVAVLAELAGYAVGQEAGEAARIATQVVGTLINLRYSREQEYEADLLGIRYMSRAGYNPWGMPELLETLAEAAGGRGGGRLQEMLQTHPLTENRIERAAAIVATEYPDAPSDLGRVERDFARAREIAADAAIPQEEINRRLEEQQQEGA